MKILIKQYDENQHWHFYCPACKGTHHFDNKLWTFNGDCHSQPTFSPSLRVFYRQPSTGDMVTICHLFVRNGTIEYCTDCPHADAGKTVPLPTLTQAMVDLLL